MLKPRSGTQGGTNKNKLPAKAYSEYASSRTPADFTDKNIRSDASFFKGGGQGSGLAALKKKPEDDDNEDNMVLRRKAALRRRLGAKRKK